MKYVGLVLIVALLAAAALVLAIAARGLIAISRLWKDTGEET